jgi:hypothetical protein
MSHRKIFMVLEMSVLILASVAMGQTGKDWVIREDGVGPVKIGMTLPELNKTLHENFTMPENKADQGCFYVKPAKHPHVAFMIEDGSLVRVDVDASGIFTAEHIQVGDSEARALRAYDGKLKVDANPYIPDKVGHYLTARSSDGSYGIRFEIEKGKIQTYYAGKFEAVQYVEGCE